MNKKKNCLCNSTGKFKILEKKKKKIKDSMNEKKLEKFSTLFHRCESSHLKFASHTPIPYEKKNKINTHPINPSAKEGFLKKTVVLHIKTTVRLETSSSATYILLPGQKDGTRRAIYPERYLSRQRCLVNEFFSPRVSRKKPTGNGAKRARLVARLSFTAIIATPPPVVKLLNSSLGERCREASAPIFLAPAIEFSDRWIGNEAQTVGD